MLAAQAPNLHGALLAAKAAGYSHVNIHGTLIATDRVAAAGATVDVFTAGGLAGLVDAAGTVRLSLPQGGIGIRYPTGVLFATLHAVPHWTRVVGIPDGLLMDDPALRPEELRGGASPAAP